MLCWLFYQARRKTPQMRFWAACWYAQPGGDMVLAQTSSSRSDVRITISISGITFCWSATVAVVTRSFLPCACAKSRAPAICPSPWVPRSPRSESDHSVLRASRSRPQSSGPAIGVAQISDAHWRCRREGPRWLWLVRGQSCRAPAIRVHAHYVRAGG